MKVNGIGVTQKGFECIITDGQERNIYARMIWAAEYSMFVSPHTRYIITERNYNTNQEGGASVPPSITFATMIKTQIPKI